MPTKSSSHFVVHGPHGPLAVQRWGDPSQPVVILVHGYPDNRSKWEPVARELSQRYQVIAYDVRGAGDSFKPTRRQDYRLEHLTADFQAVLQAVSPKRPVHLVAHDWGSVQSWEFVTDPALKGRIASFTSCSGPCLDHFGFWLRDSLKRPTPRNLGRVGLQMIKSWYVYMFQLPLVPEALWRTVVGPAWPGLMRVLEKTEVKPRPTQTSDGVHGVGLYRANVFQRMMRPRERYAHAPVQVLVPTQDHFVSPWLSENLSRWVPQLRRTEIPAGHWVTLKQPELFARHVRQFIDAIPIARASH
jgi:pimeloyl-ACP methyl ester carboxylesterase